MFNFRFTAKLSPDYVIGIKKVVKFFEILKSEMVYHHRFNSLIEAKNELFEFIEI